jgi:hypothetical protein
MNRTRRPLAALALVALISLAGCSTAPAVTSTGNGGSNTNVPAAASEGNSGGSDTANHEQAMKFAACMRDNGVSGFPDPDASGALTIDGIINGSTLDPNSAAWKTAIGACKDLEPSGFMGHKRSAQEQEAALKFAQCMRDNGVTDFQDPTENGPIIDVNGAHSIPGFQTALQKCRAVLAGALGGQ